MVIRPIPSQIMAQVQKICPACTSSDVIRYGTRKSVQLYKCKPCLKKFTDNGALPGRRVPPSQVGAAIGLFYSGMSIPEITRQLSHIFEIPSPSTATVHEWITDYTRLAINRMQAHKARTGNQWVADEMAARVGGEKLWNWNVMDVKTRYVLASHLSRTRTTRDAIALFKKARANVLSDPTELRTDRLKAYDDAVEQVFGATTKHVKSDGIRAEINNNLSERLQGTFRQRIKVLRGLQTKQSAQLFLDGWVISYNLFKPHGTIEKTPGEAASITLQVEEWEDFAKLDVKPFTKVRMRQEFRRKKSLKGRKP